MTTINLAQETLPVGSIYCIGKNYEAHAKEMANLINLDATRSEDPIVFSKPAASLIHSGEKIEIPSFRDKAISKELHHEVELVLVVAKDSFNLSEGEAANSIAGFGIGLDMTLRDLQSLQKKSGSPWLVSKGFRTSAVVSHFIASSDLSRAQTLQLQLKKNGLIAQRGNTADMLYKLPFIVSYLSHIFLLRRGDLIFTGTPEGVASVQSGDYLEAELYEGSHVLTSLSAIAA